MHNLIYLNKKITKCIKCKRLVNFRKQLSKTKRKEFINETYWGKPVPGFGDKNGKILIVGLAPAAHGGIRTGRPFTGDKSSEFLYKCLYQAKISNLSTSLNVRDGLKLKDAYITNVLKCVPPGDKPLKIELDNCDNFFKKEVQLLKNLKVIVALGKVAFDSCLKFYKKNYQINSKITFIHGKSYRLPDGKILIGSYHPSPRNVNTKLVNLPMIKKLFNKIKKIDKYKL
jgi:uracil-DNA glycosylase family 4